MHLVERHAELAMLRRRLVSAVAGRGGVVLVGAPAGYGRSALLVRLGEEIAPEVIVLRAASVRLDTGLQHGVLRQLLDPGPDPERFAAAVLELARNRPVVVLVDDVHDADPQSVRCLRLLARLAPGTALLLVVTERIDAMRPESTLDPAGELHHAVRMSLGPLTSDGIAAVLGGGLPERTAARLAPQCRRLTGGNPRLVHALLADTTDRSAVPGGVRPGEAFRRAVVNVVHRCDPAVLAPAQAMAVLGGDASEQLVGGLLDAGSGTCAALAVLEETGLAAGGALRHDVARTALLDGIAPEHRDALHARAARLLHEHGLPPVAVAAHLVVGERVAEPWVLPSLRAAADEALAKDDPPLAVDALKLALRIAGDGADRPAITAALVRAEWRIDPMVAARHLPAVVEWVLRGAAPWPTAAATIGQLLWFGHTTTAAVLAAGPGRTDPAVPADELLAAHLWLHCAFPGLFEPEAAHGPPAAGAASRVQLAFVHVLHHGPEPGAVAAVREALSELRLDDGQLPAIAAAICTLLYAEQFMAAAHWCDLFRAEAMHRGSPMWTAIFETLRAIVHLRGGELRAADRLARQALHRLPPRSWGVAIGAPLACLIQANTAMGQLYKAAAYRDVPVPDVMFHTRFGLHYLYARGRYHFDGGRLNAALADFTGCGELLDRWGLGSSAVVQWRIDAAEVMLRMGHRQRARQLVHDELRELTGEQLVARANALRVLAATSALPRRPALLTKACGALEGSGDRLRLAITIADLSRARRALGDEQHARALAARARVLAELCGAEPLLLRIEADAT
jgi:hypothetical protein